MRFPSPIPAPVRRVRTALFLFGLLLLGAAPAGWAEEWVDGKVVSVTDGDTVVVETRRKDVLRVRFYGVDAPETATEHWPTQAYGEAASRFMQQLVGGRAVSVRLTGERTHGREVGEVFVEGRSASRELLRAGLGWWNTKFARHDGDLERLEQAARLTRRGLWQEAAPVPPWQYRARHRRR